MKISLIYISLLTILSCSDDGQFEDVTLEGEEAHAAFLQWQESVQPSLDYPRSFHSEVVCQMNMSKTEFPAVEFTFEIQSDTILHDVHTFEASSNIQMVMAGLRLGGHLDWDVRPYQASIQLRKAAFVGPAILDLPKGYRLSGEFLEESFERLKTAVEEAVTSDTAYFAAGSTPSKDVYRTLVGPSAMLHPNLMSAMTMSGPEVEVTRWEIRDGVVSAEYLVLPPLWQEAQGFNQVGVAFGVLTFKSTFDAHTGDTKSFHADLVVATAAIQRMQLSYDFQFSELQENPVKFDLGEEERVLDLDPYFQLMNEGRTDEIEGRVLEDLQALDQDYSF